MGLLRRYKYFMWALYFTLCFYCMVDGYQIMMLLDAGHYEVNPALRWIIETTGTDWSLLIVKYVVLVLGGYGLIKYQRSFGDKLRELEENLKRS